MLPLYVYQITLLICFLTAISQAQIENGDDYTINYEDYMETTTPYTTTTRKPKPRPTRKPPLRITSTHKTPIRVPPVVIHEPAPTAPPDKKIEPTEVITKIDLLPTKGVEIEEVKPTQPDIPWYKCEKPQRYGSRSSYSSYFMTGSDYCHGECPRYDIVCRSKYYEVRKYPESTWAQTHVISFSYKWASRQAYQRLYKYFNKGNTRDIKMSQTSPVLAQVRELPSHDSPITTSAKKKLYNFFLYIPSTYHWYTPSPKDQRIQIRKMHPQTVFTLILEELKSETKISKAVEKFMQQLSYYEEEYLDEYYYVSYDKPGAISHHSEIWVPMRHEAIASCQKREYTDTDYEANILKEFGVGSTGPLLKNITSHNATGHTEGGSRVASNITYRYIIRDGKKIRVDVDYEINIPGVRKFDREDKGMLHNLFEKIKVTKPEIKITKPVTVPRPTRPTIKIVKIDKSGEAVDIRENDIVFEKGIKIIKTTKDNLIDIGSGIKKIITKISSGDGEIKIETGSGTRGSTHSVTGGETRGDTHTIVSGGGTKEGQIGTNIEIRGENEVHPTSPEEQASLLLKLNICSGDKCPTLSVLEFHRLGIQKRTYQNAYFLIASPDTCDYESSLKVGSEMLTSYIGGNNRRDEKLDLKEPPLTILRVSSRPSDNADCEKKFDILYYLPEHLQVNPPWPSDPKVSLRGIKDMNVFSHTIFGPVNERTIEREQIALEKKLRNVGKCAAPNEYFVTTYVSAGSDAVKSEIWMLADETCQLAAARPQQSVASLRTFSACAARGIDCPWFDQIEIHKSYEGRGYSPAQYWLTTDIKACHIDDARNLGFMRLFQYFMGENEFRSRLVMTAPTILTMRPGRANTTGEQCEETFTMSVYLHSNAPAQPLNPRVYFKRITGDVFVKIFNYTNDESVKTALYDLADRLKEDGRCYDDDEIVLAEYDQPWVTRVHSEIWMFRRWCNEAEEYEAKRTDYFATQIDDLDYFDLDYATASKFNLKLESKTDIKDGAVIADSCSKTQCAKYEVIQNYGMFVERRYSKGAKWVCSRNFGCDIDSVSKRSHTQIFNYFYGDDNIKNDLLKNTAPMVTKMELTEVSSADTSCNHDYETCSVVPEEYQADPPRPKSSSSLQIQSLENEQFYVLSYGGFTHSARIKELVLQFKRMLDAKNLPYKNVAYSAIYDDSRRVWKRHNEIWIPRGNATDAIAISRPFVPPIVRTTRIIPSFPRTTRIIPSSPRTTPAIPTARTTIIRWRKVKVTKKPVLRPVATVRPREQPEYH